MAAQAQLSAAYDALLLLCDLVYEDGDAERVDDAVTEPFAALVEDGTDLVPVLGSHDYQSGEQAQLMVALGQRTTWYATRAGAADHRARHRVDRRPPSGRMA